MIVLFPDKSSIFTGFLNCFIHVGEGACYVMDEFIECKSSADIGAKILNNSSFYDYNGKSVKIGGNDYMDPKDFPVTKLIILSL